MYGRRSSLLLPYPYLSSRSLLCFQLLGYLLRGYYLRTFYAKQFQQRKIAPTNYFEIYLDILQPIIIVCF